MARGSFRGERCVVLPHAHPSGSTSLSICPWSALDFGQICAMSVRDPAAGRRQSFQHPRRRVEADPLAGHSRHDQGDAPPMHRRPAGVRIDGAVRRTELHLEPAPTQLIASAAVYRLKLEPRVAQNIFLSAYCHGVGTPRRITYFRGLMAANRERRAISKKTGVVQTSNGVLNEALCRAMADLCMLTTQTRQGLYPYAGIPWYSTTFGRDGLITALQLLWCDPSIARGVLSRLAAHQATKFDVAVDAEPGKILHEMRYGEMAALKEVPFGLYYGSVDATPLFVILLGMYVERTGDEATLRALWPAAERALGWMDKSGDIDGDGFLEYRGTSGERPQHGLRNQGWKDSFDAVFHSDGQLAEGPIALCEVQA